MHKFNKQITKILIANRSEIASRIIHSCKVIGIKTVGIYCKQDKYLPYVYQADEAYKLTLNGALAYLNQDEVIKIAKEAKVDAIHPGYGFFAENDQFAQKVIDSGLIWIGPKPKTIKLMGDKICARKIMYKNNVPVIPGDYVLSNDKKHALNTANQIGFPIILKDPLGGGGKAIRLVNEKKDFDTAWQLATSEAKNLTGSNQLLIEKYIKNGRHIEIQIAGDGKNYIHLYERECSIQRKHQKIIEETPCNFVNEQTLKIMYQTALNATKAVQYNNIGTVEFIVTQNQDFYFLEMNTRLQVEHSVTELTTGIDLVNLQIKIAQTNKLPLKQNDIVKSNHSIECRIYAEDSSNKFLPSTGIINNLQLPSGPFIRLDHNLEENQKITPFFDPMILKITSWGNNRKTAIKNMIYALKQLKIEGIKTNIKLLKTILTSKEFESGNIDTQLLNNPIFYKKVLKRTAVLTKEEANNTHEKEIAILIAKKINPIKTNKKTIQNINSFWKVQQWK